MRIRNGILVGGSLLLMASAPAAVRGEDWPMWRYDAERTAASPAALPPELHLQWVRHLPKPQSAWPASQTKVQFDASYEPVVMDTTLFVPSMVSDHLAAFDTETGEEQWRFYTDGPVRFAPVAREGKVHFVSDDGYLYCLDARRGTLLWKVREGPPDRKVLGNDRLVSAWPARGAPVLRDGTLYFGAGLFAFMGTFIHAVDAGTGRIVWTNSGSGSEYIEQQHHSHAFANVTPQGYMAATDEVLLVSGGITVPAGYERKTGRFLHFKVSERAYGKDAGGYGVFAKNDWYFAPPAIYRAADGNGLTRAQAMVVTDDTYFDLPEPGKLVACELRLEKEEKVDRKGKKETRVFTPERWQAELDPKLDRIFIKAGPRLYGRGPDGLIAAVDLPEQDRPARVSWRAQIRGTPWSRLAADDKLFVVSQEGSIYCFGGRQGPTVEHSAPTAAGPRVSKDSQGWAQAAEIVDRTGVREGYCAVFGLADDGAFVESLLEQTALHVIGFDPDAERIDSLRRAFDRRGVYGSRIALHAGDVRSVRLPPYFASLMVVNGLKPVADDFDDRVGRVFDALRPYGGTACLMLGPGAPHDEVIRHIGTLDMPNARAGRASDWIQLRREGALPGSAYWTHQYADAANTVMSADKLARAPLGLLWFGGPPNDKILPRHGHGPTPQAAGGRVFIEGRDILRAVDAYTGRLLWEREFKDFGRFYDNTSHQPGANEIGSNYVSMPDGIYVMLLDRCLRLDPATGDTVSEFRLADARGIGDARWGSISVSDDLLIATASPISIDIKEDKADKEPPPELKPLIGANATWQYLAGSHPQGAWTTPEFTTAAARLEGWKTGPAGFGYDDDDDKTVLDDMEAHYTVVYVRKVFRVADVKDVAQLVLSIRYDDAFIAYINGKEVARAKIAKGSGRSVSGVDGHEAEEAETFEIKKPGELLHAGGNVIAIEGHNVNAGSSDFTLDPQLLIAIKSDAKKKRQPATVPAKALHEIEGVKLNAEYAAQSRTLVLMERDTGKVLWSRPAAYGFRHNAIAAAGGRVFCIDSISPAKLDQLKRRGLAAAAPPVLYALDARTGDVLWSTDKEVFGTWLGYSAEHDVLVEAGSRGPDRAHDEPSRGIAAYRGSDGKPLWKRDYEYSGPVMLRHDTIINQSWAIELETGKEKMTRHPLTGREVNWFFKRNHGCNTVIGSEHLLTFRSAAAGYYDLARDGGTGNFGGFRSGCTSNLIPACGILNAPDYTRTCTCSYQIQCSLGLVHDPTVEQWTFSAMKPDDAPIRRIGINFGAPGDRLADNDTLWLDYASVGGSSPDIPIKSEPEQPRWFRHDSSWVRKGDMPWVFASGVEGLRRARFTLAAESAPARHYTVRLFFVEPEDVRPGARVFDVTLQDQPAAKGLDVIREAGSCRTGVVREFKHIRVRDTLDLGLKPAGSNDGLATIICGIEMVAED